MPESAGDRVTLVTGAERGLGRAIAEHFLAEGGRVAAHVRTRERAEALARELGPAALPVFGDLADPDAVPTIVHACIDGLGRLDTLVNNAAAPFTTRFEQIPEDEWREAVEVNLTAPYLLIRAALPQMKAQGFGRITGAESTSIFWMFAWAGQTA